MIKKILFTIQTLLFFSVCVEAEAKIGPPNPKDVPPVLHGDEIPMQPCPPPPPPIPPAPPPIPAPPPPPPIEVDVNVHHDRLTISNTLLPIAAGVTGGIAIGAFFNKPIRERFFWPTVTTTALTSAVGFTCLTIEGLIPSEWTSTVVMLTSGSMGLLGTTLIDFSRWNVNEQQATHQEFSPLSVVQVQTPGAPTAEKQ